MEKEPVSTLPVQLRSGLPCGQVLPILVLDRRSLRRCSPIRVASIHGYNVCIPRCVLPALDRSPEDPEPRLPVVSCSRSWLNFLEIPSKYNRVDAVASNLPVYPVQLRPRVDCLFGPVRTNDSVGISFHGSSPDGPSVPDHRPWRIA